VSNADANAYLDIQIDGTTVQAVNGGPSAPASGYTLETFGFTGSGSDTLTITGNTSPAEWYVDDIVVAGTATTAVPEPAIITLLGFGLAALALMRRRRIA
jgi:hypothetical protein